MIKTEYFNLNQWESTDPIRREDFNADNAAIDAALGSLSAAGTKIAVGTYTGNGTTNTPIIVDVGFAPQMVFVWANWSNTVSSYNANYCGMAIQGQSLQNMLTLTDTGFQVSMRKDSSNYQLYPNLNASRNYFYFAIG